VKMSFLTFPVCMPVKPETPVQGLIL
jgi:hypothetical protein